MITVWPKIWQAAVRYGRSGGTEEKRMIQEAVKFAERAHRGAVKHARFVALGSRKLSEKRLRLARSFGKRPEELERANIKGIASVVVLPGQAEADEAEGPARGSS